MIHRRQLYRQVLNWMLLFVLFPMLLGFFLMLVSRSSVVAGHPRVQTGLDALGLSIAVTVFITFVINLKLETKIQNAFSIIKSCQKSGITRVFADRDEALKAINAEIPGVRQNLDVLAIAGMDFFLEPKDSMLGTISYLMSKHYASTLNIRILLLDPRSPDAIKRAMIEQGIPSDKATIASFHYTNSDLFRDILRSLTQLERLLKQNTSYHAPANFHVRTYDEAPVVMLVRCDDRLFIEQYHCGVTPLEATNELRKCVGRKIPVIETTVVSTVGHALTSHFEYVWQRSEGHEFKEGCVGRLERSLKGREVMEGFLKRASQEEELYRIDAPKPARAMSVEVGNDDQSRSPATPKSREPERKEPVGSTQSDPTISVGSLKDARS